MKFASVLAPATGHDNVSPTTTEVDTLGFDYAQFYVYFGAINASALTAFHIGESDTAGSTGAIIANTNFASTAGITAIDGSTLVLPGATADSLTYRVDVDLKGKCRYLDLFATVNNTTGTMLMSAFCLLSKADQAPITEAGQGCQQIASDP